MGLFEDLFDFNNNGKVDLDDDFLLLSMTRYINDQEKAGILEPQKPHIHKAKISESHAKEQEAELLKKLSNLLHEIRSVPNIYTAEQLGEVPTIRRRLFAFLAKVEELEPSVSDIKLHEKWRDVCREAKCSIFSVEYADELLSGRRSPYTGTAGLDRVDIEREQRELQENEPEDIKSVEWDEWYRKLKELEERILDLE